MDITPPNTPQSHQRRRRQLQRDTRESRDGSPRRRRIPVHNHDENVPPSTRTPAEPSARSLSQRRRRQLERENRPQPPQTSPPTNRSQAQAARRRAEKEAQSARMDVDEPETTVRNRQGHGPSRILQALANGILTPPPTQQLAVTRNNDQISPPNRDNSAVNYAPRGRRRVRQAVTRQLFMVARREYCDPESCHDFGPMDDVCPSCEALHWEEEKVVAQPKDARSPYGICCNHGKVALDKLKAPPEPLHRLFLGRDAQAQEFREHITQYNAALAFTSLGVNDDKSVNRHGPGAWVFRILGNLCHLSALAPLRKSLHLLAPHLSHILEILQTP